MREKIPKMEKLPVPIPHWTGDMGITITMGRRTIHTIIFINAMSLIIMHKRETQGDFRKRLKIS